MFPTCYLPVSYFPIFTTFYTISHPISFFHFQAPKSTAIAVITVLPGFNVFSICKVYLELSSLGCFLNSYSRCYRNFHHKIVTITE